MKREFNPCYVPLPAEIRNDMRVVKLRARHGMAGFGVYVALLGVLREENDYKFGKDYEWLAFDLRCDAELVRSVVEDFGLFEFTEGEDDDEEGFHCEILDEAMGRMAEKAAKLSDAGKKGADRRWQNANEGKMPQNGQAIATLSQNNGHAIATLSEEDSHAIATPSKTDSKKSKEKESKEKPSLSPTPRAGELAAEDSRKKTPVFLRQFLEQQDATGWEAVLRALGMGPGDKEAARRMVEETLAEWAVTGKEHEDYTDWVSHLLSKMRTRCRDERRDNNNGNKRNANGRETNRGTAGPSGGNPLARARNIVVGR